MSKVINPLRLLCLWFGMSSFVVAKYDKTTSGSGEIAVIGGGDAFSMRVGRTEYTIWHNKQLDWQAAYEYCESKNTSLVVLNSREKVIKLQMVLVKQNFVQAQINDANNAYIYWIGGNDLKKPKTWMWVPINAEFTYTHWLTGEPSTHGDEHCVEMGDKSLGRWSSSPCSKKRYFICEYTQKSKIRKNEL